MPEETGERPLVTQLSAANAPIALFVHQRPWHTRQTLEALAKNKGAQASTLYVFADGPRHPGEASNVEATREVVRAATGFAALIVVERESNWGLADNIIEGVDEVVRRHGKVIVIEDDLVTAPQFLTFMNAGLKRYADVPKIMHISGYMLPVEGAGLPEVALCRWVASWGWATWERAWARPERNAQSVMARFTPEMKARFNLNCDGTDFWLQLEANRDGLIRTWAVFWYAHVFLQGGLSLHPRSSLVRNIGHDGSGVHSRTTDRFDSPLRDEPVMNLDTKLEENALLLERIQRYYVAHRAPRWRVAARKVRRWLLG